MEVQFAIIGCGRIAERHALNITKYGSLTAVCDIVHGKANALSSKFNCTAYYSLADLLHRENNLQVAAICTPNGLHAAHTIQCLRTGLHVLCEKPLSIKTADAKAMIDAAKETGRNLFVVKQNRYNPPVVEVKKLLESNQLGRIYSFQINCFWNRPALYYMDTWKGTMDLDGGTLYTQFSHFIDLLYWMLGDVENVKSILKNYGHPQIEIEDTGMVLFEMKSGVTGTLNYTVNSYKKNMEGSFTIFGEKGTVKIGGEYLNELEYEMIEDHSVPKIYPTQAANDYGFYQGSMSNHDKVYADLLNALTENKHTMPNAEDGFKSVEIIEMIYNAAKL